VQDVVRHAIIYLDEGDRGHSPLPEPGEGSPASSA
jgi:hypothetical protein